MSGPTAQETFERMVGEEIWPFLRERGFKRSKGTFHRAVGPHWQVVGLQKSAYSNRDAVSFTVNLGVERAELRSDAVDRRKGKRPPVYGCHFQERLGVVLRGADTWWDVDAGMATGPLADAQVEALRRYALPWLEARSSDEGVVALMSDPAVRSAEHTHHLLNFAALLEPSGRSDLRQAVADEIEAQNAWHEAHRGDDEG